MNQDRFKFRAWDTHCKRMRDEQDFVIDGQDGQLYWVHDGEIIQSIAGRLIPMQCTGLKDSEGKLIYEGDIVEIHNGYDIKIALGIHTVVFRGIGFWFVDEEDDGFVFINPSYIIKVIGNIYENPSLKH